MQKMSCLEILENLLQNSVKFTTKIHFYKDNFASMTNSMLQKKKIIIIIMCICPSLCPRFSPVLYMGRTKLYGGLKSPLNRAATRKTMQNLMKPITRSHIIFFGYHTFDIARFFVVLYIMCPLI